MSGGDLYNSSVTNKINVPDKLEGRSPRKKGVCMVHESSHKGHLGHELNIRGLSLYCTCNTIHY